MHFEWLDEYIKRIEIEGASPGLNLPSVVEQLGSATGVAMVGESGRGCGRGVEEETATETCQSEEAGQSDGQNF